MDRLFKVLKESFSTVFRKTSQGAGFMSYTKTIVCLANSRKPPSGRCIAGRKVTSYGFGKWVRPVSARESREISEEERRYHDGSDPRVLDVISIEMIATKPLLYQKENHLIDDKCYWVKKRTLSWDDLESAVDSPNGPLWLNGCSTRLGRNDRVPEEKAIDLSRSLYLVRAGKPVLVVSSEGEDYGQPRKRVRARFTLSGHTYCFVVTDPVIERDYLAREEGEYKLNEALLCVSLGEIYNGFAYKLAASVITPERAGR
jgi:hypothetical protein